MTTYAWRQLTEAVALAAKIPVAYDEVEGRYVDADGGKFDPVRDDACAAGLAICKGLTVSAAAGFTLASFKHDGDEYVVSEYDRFNDGDTMLSFRRAVCRAIIQRDEVLKNA